MNDHHLKIKFRATSLLPWDKGGVDEWEDTSVSDRGGGHELVKLLVVPDGEKDESGGDSRSLVILSGVSGELEELSGEVLEDGGQVDWCTGSDSLGVSALTEVSGDPADWEGDAGSHRAADASTGSLSFSFAFSCHLFRLLS